MESQYNCVDNRFFTDVDKPKFKLGQEFISKMYFIYPFISCVSVILCPVITMLTLSGLLYVVHSDTREIVESQPGDPVDEHEATSHHGNSDLGCELAISQLFLVALPFLVLFVIIYQRLGLKCILLVCFLAPVLQLFQALIIKHEIFDLLRSFNVKHKVNEMQLKVQFRNFKCIFNVSQCYTVSLQFYFQLPSSPEHPPGQTPDCCMTGDSPQASSSRPPPE